MRFYRVRHSAHAKRKAFRTTKGQRCKRREVTAVAGELLLLSGAARVRKVLFCVFFCVCLRAGHPLAVDWLLRVSTFHHSYARCVFAAIDGRPSAICTIQFSSTIPTYMLWSVQVNCAAWTARATLDTTTVDVWDRMMNTNVRGPFLLVQVGCFLLVGDGYSWQTRKSRYVDYDGEARTALFEVPNMCPDIERSGRFGLGA